ncbi:hypothetical protein HKX48_006828 [Thoreauomyces humboldtii]|nr:hypothetical protein HKX48_006828 [Thoreauomyces humboldtii]
MATDVFALLEHSGWTRFHCLGYSMGGMIAQQLMLLLQGRDDFSCLRMGLLSTTPKGGWGGFAGDYHALVSGDVEMTKEKRNSLVKHLLDVNFTPDFCEKNRKVVDAEGARSMRFRKPANIIAQQLEAIATFDLAHQIHRIAVPTLVVHGTDDGVVPFQGGVRIAKSIPNARFVALQDVGHLTYLMDSGETARLFEGFFAGTDSADKYCPRTGEAKL